MKNGHLGFVTSGVMCLLLSTGRAHALERYWSCDSDWWDSSCWSSTPTGYPYGPGYPLPGNFYLYNSSVNDIIVSYRNSSYPDFVMDSYVVDATSTGSMTLSQTIDILRTELAIVGDTGNGAVDQTGGDHIVNTSLILGNTATGNGSFTLSDSANMSTGILRLGDEGAGHMTVQNGATVNNSGMGYIGNRAGSTGTLTVSGPSATFTSNDDFYIGRYGTGSVNVLNGATMTTTDPGIYENSSTILGQQAGSSGSAIVDGAGSTWNTNSLYVGQDGNADLQVTNGGSIVSNRGVNIAGTATVDGTGSSIVADDGVSVVGSLSLINGGTITGRSGSVANRPGENATVTIDGAGSTWNAEQFAVSGILRIQNGGTLNSPLGSINSNGTATVDGTGSVWQVDSLTVGRNSIGTLNIQNGGQVQEGSNLYGDAVLGDYSGSSGTVNMDGVGSTWGINRTLKIGWRGNGEVNVHNGAQISAYSSWVSYYADSTASINLVGAGSRLNITDSIHIGYLGNAEVTIQDGARLASGDIGRLANSYGSNAMVTVDGAGSSWNNGGHLSVGFGGNGVLQVVNGGAVNSSGSAIGYQSGSNGSVTVSGLESSWTNSGELSVGGAGNGTLSILNGGQVSTTTASISGSSSTTGATIDGEGSRWTIDSSLTLGRSYGGNASLNIQNQGVVTVNDTLKVWQDSAVHLSGGQLSASQIYIYDGEFNFTGGKLAVSTFNGNLHNLGGTLAPGNSPGSTQILGDYTQSVDGIFNVEIGGLAPGSEYDTLDVTGTASLAGTLELDWYDLGSGLFSGSEGDSFDVLTAEILYGEFDLLTLAMLDEGLDWQINYLTDAIGDTDVVRLSIVSAVPVPPAIVLFLSGLISMLVLRRKTG